MFIEDVSGILSAPPLANFSLSLAIAGHCDVCHVELTMILTTGRHGDFLDSP